MGKDKTELMKRVIEWQTSGKVVKKTAFEKWYNGLNVGKNYN